MMQHRKIDGAPIEIRPFAEVKLKNARQAETIRITQISMASKRIMDDEPSLAAWFCLRVQDRREFSVEKALCEVDVHACVPTYIGDRILKRGRIIPVPRLPVVPGYVLVRCVPSPSAMVGLRRFKGVQEVVGTAAKPYRVPDKFMNKFIEQAAEGTYDYRPPAPTEYVPGEHVRVIDGHFASFGAVVLDWDGEANRVKVEVHIFGRETPVDLDVAQIEKV